MLTFTVDGGDDTTHVKLALDETLDGTQLSLYTFDENALLRHVGTHAAVCINASNRARVTVTVNRAIAARKATLVLCASSGAQIDCVLPPIAYTRTISIACAYVLIRCEGFDSVVDLNSAFDVQCAIVMQSGKSSQVRNFHVVESIYTRLEEPTNLVNVSIDPTRGCRHELLSSKFAQWADGNVRVDIKHKRSLASACAFSK